MRKFSDKFFGFGVCAFALSASGCVVDTTAIVGESEVTISAPLGNLPDLTNQERPAVCDPFGRTEASVDGHGLVAQMFYAGNACTTANAAQCDHYPSVGGYIQNSIPLDADLIFNQVNVPTRPYDGDVFLQNGTPILSPQGDSLFEWFALRFNSQIKLGPNDAPGRYQLSLMADDGAVLSLNTGNGLQTWIDNDHDHPSKMACATQIVQMDANTVIPMRLDYYQGPRYHIALILAWRKISDTANLTHASTFNDAACGLEGNDTFFDSNQVPSAPKSTWTQFLGRGWKVLTPENYQLPASRFTNPCPGGDGSCFTDSYNHPTSSVFALSESGVDPSSLKVTVDGRITAFSYNAASNRLTIPGLPASGAGLVKIGYCKLPGTGGPNPSASPSPTPTPTPTQTQPPVYVPPAS